MFYTWNLYNIAHNSTSKQPIVAHWTHGSEAVPRQTQPDRGKERGRQAGHARLFCPAPGRVMRLGLRRPHSVCRFQLSESVDCHLAAYMRLCLYPILGTQPPEQK